MRKINLKLSCLAVVAFLGTVSHAYKFASVNDIHADLNYDPANKGSCINKTVVPDQMNSLNLVS